MWCFPNPIMTQVEAGRKKGTGCGHTSCLGKYQRVCGSEWGVKANSIPSLPITQNNDKIFAYPGVDLPSGKAPLNAAARMKGCGSGGRVCMAGEWLVVNGARRAGRPPPSLPKSLSFSPTAICGIPSTSMPLSAHLVLIPLSTQLSPLSCLDHCVQTGGVFRLLIAKRNPETGL